MFGFESFANAAVVIWDGDPLLSVDPWFAGNPFFGSWGHAFAVPEAQQTHARQARNLWISHGHPDHLHLPDLEQIEKDGLQVWLPDHRGGRIANDLSSAGFDVRIMTDNTWYELSPRVRIMSLSDACQDAALVICMGDTLVMNLNDVMPRSFPWTPLLKKLSRTYARSFLLKKFTYRDAAMTHFFDEEGEPISLTVNEEYVGRYASFWAKSVGATDVIPSASFHRYSRTDSHWANATVAPLDAYPKGFDSTRARLHPPFVSLDFDQDTRTEGLRGEPLTELFEPAVFGDHWSDDMEPADREKLDAYFRGIPSLEKHFDFMCIRFGNQEHTIEFKRRGFQKGFTFEAPRNSFMQAVEWEVFDDLLIANFMRTTLHGKWSEPKLYPGVMGLTRYADNGRVRSPEALRAYLADYRRRAPTLYLRQAVEGMTVERVRPLVIDHPRLFKVGLKLYGLLR